MGKREKQERSRILKLQVAAFRKKFGRDPLPNEPVFFDPDADVLTPMNEEKMRNSRGVQHRRTAAGICLCLQKDRPHPYGRCAFDI